MVGTTIHNLLIEISGFAGILESIEFAFYKCRKFSSMARLSLLSRPCSRCWNVFVVFQEAEFCLWNLKEVFSWCTKQKNKMYILRWNCSNQKWIIELPFPEPLHMKSGMIRLTPTKSSLVSPPSPPKNQWNHQRHSHVLPLLDMRQVVVFEHPGQIRPGYCPAITVHTSQAGYLQSKRSQSWKLSFCVSFVAAALVLEAAVWNVKMAVLVRVVRLARLVLFRFVFLVLSFFLLLPLAFFLLFLFFLSLFCFSLFASFALLFLLLVSLSSCFCCFLCFLSVLLLVIMITPLMPVLVIMFLFLFFFVLVSFVFFFFFLYLLIAFLFSLLLLLLRLLLLFLVFRFKAWCHLPGAVWVRRTPQQGGSLLGFSHDTSAIVLVSIPECLWKKAAPQYIKHHRKTIEAAKRVSASALISGAFGMCSHVFWILLTFQKLGGQR